MSRKVRDREKMLGNLIDFNGIGGTTGKEALGGSKNMVAKVTEDSKDNDTVNLFNADDGEGTTGTEVIGDSKSMDNKGTEDSNNIAKKPNKTQASSIRSRTTRVRVKKQDTEDSKDIGKNNIERLGIPLNEPQTGKQDLTPLRGNRYINWGLEAYKKQPLIYTQHEIVEMLGVSIQTLQKHIRLKNIKMRQLGGKNIVLVKDLESFLDGLPMVWDDKDEYNISRKNRKKTGRKPLVKGKEEL